MTDEISEDRALLVDMRITTDRASSVTIKGPVRFKGIGPREINYDDVIVRGLENHADARDVTSLLLALVGAVQWADAESAHPDRRELGDPPYGGIQP